ncbi:N-acetyltransferase [Thiospirochaeta perfilievii]|uniref:N-acetyltransferase n=1 Tax=Thiospirochaeta perfilievii TaxID=252967 RepID=A0A5C1QCA5_9SPIO|nr:GNAT family protein [Thiospirochaeta perfilievii]QEN04968.1 N-acetyltransferase [Thiospirochaeta perfilievii]
MILKTDRLLLRPFSIEDSADFFSISSDPMVTEFLTWGPHIHMEESLESIQTRFINNTNVFCIEHRDDNKCIGCIDLRFDNTNKKVGFGYMLSQSYWGSGYMTETLKAVLDYIFSSFDINKVEASYYVGNPGSGRVMEKCGMVYEGTQKESLIIKNKFVDVVNYGLTKKDFLDFTQPLINKKPEQLLDEILR